MRSIWSGSLTFGLVTIPVKLYVATNQRSLDLHMLHKKDMSPIRFARVCKLEEKEVPYDEITRGYEIEKDDFVVLTDSDIKKANVEKSQTIDILHFTDEDEIDSVYYEKPYYLEPGKGADKSYDLLLEALKRSKKVGIAKFVLRTKENLAVIKPYKNVLVLNELRYAHEIRSTTDLAIPDRKMVNEKEINMALMFIRELTEKFSPSKYNDTYREELERIIKEKSEGKTITVHGKEPQPTKVNDLMAALKASLKQQHAHVS